MQNEQLKAEVPFKVCVLAHDLAYWDSFSLQVTPMKPIFLTGISFMQD